MPESNTIAVRCPCGTKIRLPEAAAGKKAKCPKCAKIFRVPAAAPEPTALNPPAATAVESTGGEGLLEELAAMEQSASSAEGPRTFSGKMPCVQCGATMDADARICVQCGYNTATGKVLKQASAKQAKAAAAVRKAATGASAFLIGTVLSGVGALVGAGIWCAIAMASGYGIGWIAWGIGLLAGFGMMMGYRQQNTRAGVVAACMALMGLVAGKVMIFVFVIYAVVSGSTSNRDIQRGFVADGIIQDMLDDRGIYEEDERERMYDSLRPAATKRAARMGDDQLQLKFDEYREVVFGLEGTDAQVFQLAEHHSNLDARRRGLSYEDPERQQLFDKYEEQFGDYSETELEDAVADLESWQQKDRWEDAAYLRSELIYARMFEEDGDIEGDQSKEAWSLEYQRAMAKVDAIPAEQHALELRKIEAEGQLAMEAMEAELEALAAEFEAEAAGDFLELFIDGSFGFMDLLFALLAVGSAYKLASGGSDD